MQSPNQLEANRILLEAICQKDGAAQHQYVQQVEEGMGRWDSGEETSVHYPRTASFEPDARWPPALGDSSCRLFGDFRDLAALENIVPAEWIWRHLVEMFLKKCASAVQEVMKKGKRVNKRPAMDLGECASNTTRGNIPELPNTTFMVVICQVPNGNNDQSSGMQLQASYTDVRHWE